MCFLHTNNQYTTQTKSKFTTNLPKKRDVGGSFSQIVSYIFTSFRAQLLCFYAAFHYLPIFGYSAAELRNLFISLIFNSWQTCIVSVLIYIVSDSSIFFKKKIFNILRSELGGGRDGWFSFYLSDHLTALRFNSPGRGPIVKTLSVQLHRSDCFLFCLSQLVFQPAKLMATMQVKGI